MFKWLCTGKQQGGDDERVRARREDISVVREADRCLVHRMKFNGRPLHFAYEEVVDFISDYKFNS